MKGYGAMAKKMGRVLTLSRQEQSMKVFGRMGKNTDKAHSPGPTVTSILENGMLGK